MVTEEYIIKTKYELNEILFKLDPMGLGTVENNLHDEYTKEADDIIEQIAGEINSGPELSIKTICRIAIRITFAKQFYPLMISEYYIDIIATVLYEKFAAYYIR